MPDSICIVFRNFYAVSKLKEQICRCMCCNHAPVEHDVTDFRNVRTCILTKCPVLLMQPFRPQVIAQNIIILSRRHFHKKLAYLCHAIRSATRNILAFLPRRYVYDLDSCDCMAMMCVLRGRIQAPHQDYKVGSSRSSRNFRNLF